MSPAMGDLGLGPAGQPGSRNGVTQLLGDSLTGLVDQLTLVEKYLINVYG
jgi:hypothetical protein